MPRPRKPIQDRPLAIRLPEPLIAQIKEVAKLMGESEVEIIRLATRIGLEQLRRIDYNLAKAIVDAAERRTFEPEALKAAESPPPYGPKKKGNG